MSRFEPSACRLSTSIISVRTIARRTHNAGQTARANTAAVQINGVCPTILEYPIRLILALIAFTRATCAMDCLPCFEYTAIASVLYSWPGRAASVQPTPVAALERSLLAGSAPPCLGEASPAQQVDPETRCATHFYKIF